MRGDLPCRPIRHGTCFDRAERRGDVVDERGGFLEQAIRRVFARANRQGDFRTHRSVREFGGFRGPLIGHDVKAASQRAGDLERPGTARLQAIDLELDRRELVERGPERGSHLRLAEFEECGSHILIQILATDIPRRNPGHFRRTFNHYSK